MKTKEIFLIVAVVFPIFIISYLSFSQNQQIAKNEGIIYLFTEDGNVLQTVLDFLDKPSSFVYVSALDVSHEKVIEKLENLKEKGVDVKIITERPNSNLPSKFDLSKGLHHCKFIVTENGVIFGSANFSKSGLETGCNDIIIFPGEYSQRFKKFFEDIWEDGLVKPIEGFYVSPVEDVETFVLKEISKSKKRIYVCMYAFTNKKILALLKYKESQGVDVKIITDSWYTTGPLKDISFSNMKIIRHVMLHHKFIIIDGTLLTGSTNYTENAFTKNVEIMYKTKLVDEYLRIFDFLWYN